MNEEIKGVATETKACGCDGGSCMHQEESIAGFMTKHRGSREMEFAFLLALTPLAVLTFFGQVGLL